MNLDQQSSTLDISRNYWLTVNTPRAYSKHYEVHWTCWGNVVYARNILSLLTDVLLPRACHNRDGRVLLNHSLCLLVLSAIILVLPMISHFLSHLLMALGAFSARSQWGVAEDGSLQRPTRSWRKIWPLGPMISKWFKMKVNIWTGNHCGFHGKPLCCL